MALVGILTALIGGAMTTAVFSGIVTNSPLPLGGWAGIMALGLVVYFLSRRPNN